LHSTRQSGNCHSVAWYPCFSCPGVTTITQCVPLGTALLHLPYWCAPSSCRLVGHKLTSVHTTLRATDSISACLYCATSRCYFICIVIIFVTLATSVGASFTIHTVWSGCPRCDGSVGQGDYVALLGSCLVQHRGGVDEQLSSKRPCVMTMFMQAAVCIDQACQD
jgi:hypothetical protein